MSNNIYWNNVYANILQSFVRVLTREGISHCFHLFRHSSDLEGIEYAILEPNGEISILPKKDISPPKDLNMNVEFSGLPIAVVIEGKIQHKNLKLMNKSEQWLQKELKDSIE
jgi:Protein of unknown function (DUF421)